MSPRWRRAAAVLLWAGAGGARTGLVAQASPPLALADRPARLEVRGAPLVETLRELQSRSGVAIAFSPEALPASRVVSCACLASTVGEALDTVLRGTGLAFIERRSQILVVPRTSGEAGTASRAVVGWVRENGSGQPIRPARVTVRERGLATLTDDEGRFILLPVPPGRYTLDVDALGFRAVEGVSTEVSADAPARVDVDLSPDPLALAEIVVAPGTFGMLENVSLRPQTLSRAEMDALPQLGEDVFRTMERMPGVATDDISARLSVRGGNEDELLIMLDGTELIEPYHMRDLDAVVGVVDVETLRGVSLVAGGLPTEHGDRMSGLLDMRTKQPIGQGARHSVGLSASNATLRTQGTFADGRGGWLVSGRRGFLDLLLAMASASEGGDGNEELSPRYFDVMAKVALLAGSDHRISVHVLYAGDQLDLETRDGPSDHASLGSDWANLNVWGAWDWRIDRALDVSTVVSAIELSRLRSGTYASPGSSEVADFADVDDRNDVGIGTVRQDWLWALADGAVLKLGGQVRRAAAEYRYSSFTGREFVRPDGSVAVAYDTTRVDLSPSATESTAYLATRLRPWDGLTLEVGARYEHRTLTSDSNVSPRVHGALDIAAGTTLRASWGVHRQSHGVEELSVADGDTTFFRSEVATQIALGVEHRFDGGVVARLEAYHRRVDDQRPRYLNVSREIIPLPEVGNDRVRFLPEEGRARGAELMLSGPSGERSAWSATYVLAQAQDRSGEEWIARTLDQRHTVSLRWHYRPGDRWQLSAGWQYHTGWPTTPMEFEVDTIPGAGPGERQLLVSERPGPINAGRLPDYHRMDFRATRAFHVGRGELRVFLDVFNLYNRRNLRSYDYKVQLPDGAVIPNSGETLLPLLPSFGFTWEF